MQTEEISAMYDDNNPSKITVSKKPSSGMKFERKFCEEKDVWETVTWVEKNATITDENGKSVFEQKGIDTPDSWSQTAINVVAAKYFRGHVDSPTREKSIKHLVDRVSSTITKWGLSDGYFDEESGENFYQDLSYILLHQMASFNSPVWFNLGAEEHPQCSACFIQSLEDDMGAIMDLAKNEAMLFKGGSGTGTNFSKLRGSMEKLNGGGLASGPVSFMKGFDSFAGVIKSGGKTRRAAKMVILDIEHPDILQFIRCKAEEEKKAHTLIAGGYDADFNGPAYESIHFQNANHSIRVNDTFMSAVESNGKFSTRARKDGSVLEELDAKQVLFEAAKAAHECGDPGIQFDSIINAWHTCKAAGRISGSNPCSEYMFLDDSACNLSSINLLKFLKDDGNFDVGGFRHVSRVMTTAMEIIVGNSRYPTPKITENSIKFRPLGLGFSNLGSYLMRKGLPYDSMAARALAGGITSLMCGEAYRTSAELAGVVGPFSEYESNKESMLAVLHKHSKNSGIEGLEQSLEDAIHSTWAEVHQLARTNGIRNAQTTVLAPTGTISFMMDCETTGIEPEMALVKYKKLVGGGNLKLVNSSVKASLQSLGYAEDSLETIVDYAQEKGTIEGAPGLSDAHLPVFDCAFRGANGIRTISPMGHVRMMAACQPFLSGAISKTVNMPEDTTVDEIFNVYLEAWKLGLKAVAVYRDGCKQSQPISTRSQKTEAQAASAPKRKSLPSERQALTHKFSVGGQTCYLTVGLYPDGRPGEIFLQMAKEGSTVSGMMDSFAIAISVGLQYGVPLEVLVRRFSHTRFEPSGITNNADIRIAHSVIDYIFRWLGHKYLSHEVEDTQTPPAKYLQKRADFDGPPCPDCGAITIRAGSCHTCPSCGSSTGCG